MTGFLKQVIELFMNVKIGIKGAWKPIQTGVVTTRKSLLGLQDLLLDRKGVSFSMTSRFSQDDLENLFSIQDESTCHYDCIVSHRKKKSNYQNDKSDYLTDFLKFRTHSTSKGETQPPKLFCQIPSQQRRRSMKRKLQCEDVITGLEFLVDLPM